MFVAGMFKKVWPILFCQSWYNWGKSLGRTDTFLAQYTGGCLFFSRWNLLPPYLLCLEGIINCWKEVIKFRPENLSYQLNFSILENWISIFNNLSTYIKSNTHLKYNWYIKRCQICPYDNLHKYLSTINSFEIVFWLTDLNILEWHSQTENKL